MSVRKGVFRDLTGLAYKSGPDLTGFIDEDGGYEYNAQGPDIQWFIGDLFLGQTLPQARTSIIDLLLKSKGDIQKAHVLTKARLLCSLSPEIDMRSGIHVSTKVRNAITKHSAGLNLESQDPTAVEPVLKAICTELGTTIKTVAHVRNYLRRLEAGFTVWRDIKIPVREGTFVFGDVYLPLDRGKKYPALASLTTYGKRTVYSGPNLADPDDVAAFELVEDRFHSTTADADLVVPHTGAWFGNWTKQRGYETIAMFNPSYWTARGYAMVKIDPQGVAQTPGTRDWLGQETDDFFDAIEWIAEQDWCTGNVATVGNSYGANTQWNLGHLRPRGLKAMVPYAGDTDFYREVTYNGGIGLFKYLDMWIDGIRAASRDWPERGDWLQEMRDHPFYDDYWERRRAQVDKITLPVFVAASQQAIVHGRGAFEAYRRVLSTDKYLQVVDTNYYAWPNHTTVHKIQAFLDRHLKDAQDNDLERVGMQMRIGQGQWYWRTENDWPVPGTSYVDWHFQPDLTLSTEPKPGTAKGFPYSAEVGPSEQHAGVSFTSAAFEFDMELAGHLSAMVNISSSSNDADVFVLVWVLDEQGLVVRYGVDKIVVPAAQGLLRASRRRVDSLQTLPERPVHTHREADVQLLKGPEIVELDIEINPMTARIRKGWKLRVDILPSDCQPDMGYHPRSFREVDDSYHRGAVNTLHVGGQYTNKLKVAVVPLKDGPLGVLWPEGTT